MMHASFLNSRYREVGTKSDNYIFILVGVYFIKVISHFNYYFNYMSPWSSAKLI